MAFSVKNNISKKFTSNYNLQDKIQERKNFKKKQAAKNRFLAIVWLFVGFILVQMFINTWNYLFVRRIENTAVEIPNNLSFLRSSEKYFSNDYFLDTQFLGNVEYKKPLMKTIPLTKKMPNLTNRLKNLVNQYPSIEPGIFIWDFSTGSYVNINADKEFPTASMIKIPVLFQLYKRIEQKNINPASNITLTKNYLTEGSGFLQYKPVGTILSVYNLARLMMQESDNTATNILLSSVGGINELNRNLRLWGFDKTHMSNLLPDLYGTNISTPKDMGIMLYNIDNPDFLTLKSSAQMINIMSHVKNRFLIQSSLPNNAQFIHKTGNIGGMIGDAGIAVFPDGRKYIIAIMVKRPWNSYTGKEFIIKASQIAYDAYSHHSY